MERLGPAVGRELRRAGNDATSASAEIAAVWAEAVGDTIARNAWPLRIGRDGTLHVATASATWAFELDRLAAEIAARLAERLGPSSPGKLRFRPGPLPEPPKPPEGSTGRPPEGLAPPPPQVARRAAEAASAIADPELRELVERAARASLARTPSGRSI